jgi:uncharacterized protein (TIGR00290 family)
MKTMIKDQPFFCSWSGGKDSCLALHHAIRNGGAPKRLFTMLAEDGVHSRSHNLSKALLEEQARRMGIPITFAAATWNDYEAVFLAAIRQFRADGLATGVFGDIDVDSNLEWVRRVCATADVTPCHPLWKKPRVELLAEFIALGFKATVVVTNDSLLPPSFLGKVMTPETVAEMEQAGIDASGELGEYHTVVTDGPLFSSPINLRTGKRLAHEGYSFLEILD